jgi:polyhydroxyalkanoate synthase
LTFVLASGGHNAGIVSEPGHKGRNYQVHTRPVDGKYTDPDTWAEEAARQEGSWWPARQGWLAEYSSELMASTKVGSLGRGGRDLGDAPGALR